MAKKPIEKPAKIPAKHRIVQSGELLMKGDKYLDKIVRPRRWVTTGWPPGKRLTKAIIKVNGVYVRRIAP